MSRGKWKVYKCQQDHGELREPHIVVELDGFPAAIVPTFDEAWNFLRNKVSEPA